MEKEDGKAGAPTGAGVRMRSGGGAVDERLKDIDVEDGERFVRREKALVGG